MVKTRRFWLLAVAVGLCLWVTACARDDPLSNPVPTLPVVTTFTTSTTGTTAGADGTTAGTTTSTTTTTAATTTTTTTVPVTPEGDVRRANIDLQHLITLDRPIDMIAVPGDPHPWIAERHGLVHRVDLAQGTVVETVLNITAETKTESEQGLLGIAATEGWLYVNFTDLNGNTRVDAFQRQGTGLGTFRRTILTQHQPYGNHNGGDLAIGPGGELYIAFGDGGSAKDPLNSGQNPSSWLGAILRIVPTPRADSPYAIPADNPFDSASTRIEIGDAAGSESESEFAAKPEGAPEVFITGLRNPWRFSFDQAKGDVWIADVGQDRYEEVTVLLAANRGGAGANLGWRLREGLHAFAGEKPPGNIDPVWVYGRDSGCSVTGGHIYRGTAIPDLYGTYVFGDYCTSRLWGLQISRGEIAFRDFGVDVPGGDLVSFGQDASGELYAISLAGPISKVIQQ